MAAAAFVVLSALGGAVAAPQNSWGGSWNGGHGNSQAWPFPTPTLSTCAPSNEPPSYHRNSSFTFPATPDPGYASSVSPSPAKTYALPYAQVSSLFSNVSTTSWPNWTPGGAAAAAATSAADADPYDEQAYSALWDAATPTNFTRGIYSTTASPITIPTSELAKPTPLYFKPESCYQFPKDFIFGTAGSAGQCEGAVADEGKSPSFLDLVANVVATFGQSSSSAVTGMGSGQLTNNAVTLEHYYLYKQDIDRLAAAGIKHFYFTLAWTRILPFALPGTPVNQYGIDHYNDVIDYVLSKGMVPVVALTHFDTPLQFYGGGDYLTQVAEAAITGVYGLGGISFGYQNATFEDAYVNYAKIALSHFADRVGLFVSFNEPQVGSPNAAAVINVLRAHARAYRFYKDELKGTGKFTIKMGITPATPLDAGNQSHVEAAQYFTDLYTFPYLYPTVFGQQFPDAFLKTLPDARPLTSDELALMNGTMDFISIDGYSAPIVYPAVADLNACATGHNLSRPFPICVNATTLSRTGWATGYSPAGSPTDYSEPMGLRTQLNYVWSTFGLPILISEFGLSVPVPPGGRIQDNLFNVPQSEYLLSYLNEMLKAIWEDGVHVMGALVWNFLDDWEFGFEDYGYGLMYLNWSSPTKERLYRRSIFDVVDFVEGRRQT